MDKGGIMSPGGLAAGPHGSVPSVCLGGKLKRMGAALEYKNAERGGDE